MITPLASLYRSQMKITIVFLFLLLGCTTKQALKPDWFINVDESSRLKVLDEKLYLIEPKGTFEIDLITGKKKEVYKNSLKNDPKKIGKTRKKNILKKWQLKNRELTYYTLYETYSPTDDCQTSSHKYWLEKVEKNKTKKYYTLGNNERSYVSDFEVILNALYIIKNPASGGDAIHLEKYNIIE